MDVERLNVASDGKRFYCEFMREGPVNQGRNGLEVIRRGVIDAALQTMIGAPLVIKHVKTNIPRERLNAVKHGTVDKVGYNSETGFYFCEGSVDTDEAREAAKTMRPSCGFQIITDVPGAQASHGGRWNNIAFDREITAFEFHHLALEDIRPRYEESKFRLNAVTEETQPGNIMSFFKLFRTKKPAEAGAAAVTEEFDLPADAEITLPDGTKSRLNSVVEDATAERTRKSEEERKRAAAGQRLNVAELPDDADVEISPGKIVKVGVLKAAHAAAESATSASVTRTEEDRKKLERLNAVEKEAGRTAFETLEAAQRAGSLERLNSVPPEDSFKRGNY